MESLARGSGDEGVARTLRHRKSTATLGAKGQQSGFGARAGVNICYLACIFFDKASAHCVGRKPTLDKRIGKK